MSNADPGRTRPVFQWLAQLFALMGKESKQIIRDPSSYLVAAILPMIFLLLFGYGITLDAGVMDIVILDESNSQSGLQLQENFAHSPNFRVHQARSRSEAGRMMRDSVISGFIVIPYNFEALLVGGQGKAAVAPIQVIVSGGEPNTANFIRGYSQGVIAGRGDGTFAPENNITREEFATMLARYAQKYGNYTAGSAADFAAYGDASAVDSWAAEYVAWAVKGGYMGKNTNVLTPLANMTRAEAAAMVVRYAG